MDRRYLLAVLPVVFCVVLTGSPASAGIFFGKKAKPSPAEHVPELIKTLQADGDEHKRCAAAEELRQYDPMQFPEMVPALIEALLNEKKPAVRAESAQTLGKLRPVTATVGTALDQALTKDSSMRVRLQARTSLLQYRWSGYSPKGKEEPVAQPPAQSKEPPLAADLPAPAQTAAPRLAPVPTAASSLPPAPRPLPAGPSVRPPAPSPAGATDLSAPVQATPSSFRKTPKPTEEKGPDLTPP